jgi:hypothetical protein
MIPQHSSESVEHFTPLHITALVDELMDGIVLDPASTPLANEGIGALHIYTAEDDGLTKHWSARSLFLNPPGGKAPENRFGIRSNAALWWWKLARSWSIGAVTEAVFVGFTMEIMRTTQLQDVPSVLHFPFCIPRRRIAFDKPDAEFATRVASKSPAHGNVLVYLPPVGAGVRGKHVDWANPYSVEWEPESRRMQVSEFKRLFGQLGEVRL